MTAARPTIPFDQVKKFGTDGKLDLNTTLGAIFKAHFNQNSRIKLQGNLSVRYEAEHKSPDKVFILSDNKVDKIFLHWSKAWFSPIDTPSRWDRDQNGIKVWFHQFDRQFILPYLAELRTRLSGQQPAEFLMLQEFQRFAETYNTNIQFDAKEMPSFGKYSGDVTVTLHDGKKIVGARNIKADANISDRDLDRHSEFAAQIGTLEFLERVKRNEQLLRLSKTDLIKTLLSEIKPKPPNGGAANIRQALSDLYVLANCYGDDSRFAGYHRRFFIDSLFEPLRKIIVDHIINTLLPKVTICDLLQRVPNDIWTYYTFSYFDYLLLIKDRDILSALVVKAHRERVDLNKINSEMSVLQHIQQWKCSHIPLIEYRKILLQLFAAGLDFTPEVDKEISEHASTEEIRQLYEASKKAYKPASLVFHDKSEWEEQKPLVRFESAARFHSEHQLDVTATVGELMKQTCNAKAGESKRQSGIRGTLKLTTENFKITIRSDHAEDDLQQLAVMLDGKVEKTADSKGIIATLHQVDRRYIWPYLAEFQKHLNGKHPLLDFLMDSPIIKRNAESYNGFSIYDYASSADYINDIIRWVMGILILMMDGSPDAIQSLRVEDRQKIEGVLLGPCMFYDLKGEDLRSGCISKILDKYFLQPSWIVHRLNRMRVDKDELKYFLLWNPLYLLSTLSPYSGIRKVLPENGARWYVRRTLDEGVDVLAEIENRIKSGSMSRSDADEIGGEYVQCILRQLVELPCLTFDVWTVVLRYLFRGEFVTKASQGFFAKSNIQSSLLVGFREERSTQPTMVGDGEAILSLGCMIKTNTV